MSLAIATRMMRKYLPNCRSLFVALLCIQALGGNAETLPEIQDAYDKARPATLADGIAGEWSCSRVAGSYNKVTTVFHGSCGTAKETIRFRNDAGSLIGNLSAYFFSENTFAPNAEHQMTSQLKFHAGTMAELTYTATVRMKTDGSLIIFLQHPTEVSDDTTTYFGPFLQCQNVRRYREGRCTIL